MCDNAIKSRYGEVAVPDADFLGSTMDSDSLHLKADTDGRVDIETAFDGGRVRFRGKPGTLLELAAGLGTAILKLGGENLQVSGFVDVFNDKGRRVIQVNGRDGDIRLFNSKGQQSVSIEGQSGDIKVAGADAAEFFDYEDFGDVRPGYVMVIASEGRLAPGCEPYDRRVAGVVSGAGTFKPGLVLGASTAQSGVPVALAGRAYCLVDASYGAIKVGDLLTTSATRGHAMKVTDNGRALGAVVGKAMSPMPKGVGLIPVLISLQ